MILLTFSWSVENWLHIYEHSDFIEEEAYDADAATADAVEAGHAADLLDNVGGVHT